MPVVLGVADGLVGAAVVRGGVALAKVVGLDLVNVAAEPLPINLVQVVRLQDHAADDAGSGGGLDHGGDGAEEDVELGLHRRGVTRLGNGERETIVVIAGVAIGHDPVRALSRGEVDRVGRLVQTNIRGAGGYSIFVSQGSFRSNTNNVDIYPLTVLSWVAVRVSLGESHSGQQETCQTYVLHHIVVCVVERVYERIIR